MSANGQFRDSEVVVRRTQVNGEWVETPYVSIVRTPQAQRNTVVLDVQSPPRHLPFRVALEGDGWERKLQVDERKIYRVQLPPTEHSELVTLKFKGKSFRADPSSLGTKVTFESQPEGQP